MFNCVEYYFKFCLSDSKEYTEITLSQLIADNKVVIARSCSTGLIALKKYLFEYNITFRMPVSFIPQSSARTLL